MGKFTIDGVGYETNMSEEFLSQLTPEEREFLIVVEEVSGNDIELHDSKETYAQRHNIDFK